jgi:hypothetical protein
MSWISVIIYMIWLDNVGCIGNCAVKIETSFDLDNISPAY